MSGAIVALITTGAGFQAAASPDALTGFKIGTGTVYTSGPSAVTVQGGQPPYTYAWTSVSGSILIYPQVATSYSTRFYTNFTSPGDRTATYKCVVTDANAAVVDSNDVTISLSSL